MSKDEFKNIIDRFESFICEIYFSPPFGREFHSRLEVADNLDPSRSVEGDVFDILQYGSEKRIRINMALNTWQIAPDKALSAVRRAREYLDLESVTTVTRYAGALKDAYPNLKLTCSYNQGIKTTGDVDEIAATGLFNSLVLGNSTLREFPLFRHVNSLGMKTRFLVNNGCTFACRHFCNPSSFCKQTFDTSVANRGIHKVYAEQSIQPWELHDYYLDCQDIQTIKISNRPSDRTWLVKCLISYIDNINHRAIIENPGNYHLWARLAHLSTYYESIDYGIVQEWKRKIWREVMTPPREG